ncbi:MAG TPA: PilZ domain-containing protein [Pirellulales bacterium]|nr:PilZ domain-containing protein [Pirellulales bacterium]
MSQTSDVSAWLIGSGAERRVRDAINRLLDRSLGTTGFDRRGTGRSPFSGPVTISVEGEEVPRFSAFARDISPLGVGLLHMMRLEPGQVIVTLCGANGETLSLRTQVIWCESAGEGWYTSGGRFLDVFDYTSRDRE